MAKKTKEESKARLWFKQEFPSLTKKQIDNIGEEVIDAIYLRYCNAECFECEFLGEDNACTHSASYCPVRPDTSKCCRYCFENCYHVCGRLVKQPE
jgi:hypothetical protein